VAGGDGDSDLRHEEDEGKGEMQIRGPEESSQRRSSKKTMAATRTHGLLTQRGSIGRSRWTAGRGA
jgi:hypothetical protein